jgi:hypothetical protein
MPGATPANSSPVPGADVTSATTAQSEQLEQSSSVQNTFVTERSEPSEQGGSVRNTLVSYAGNESRPRTLAGPDEVGRSQIRWGGSERSQPASSQGAAPAMSYSGGFATPPDPAPWAATRCVVAFHMDPSDLQRWTIENDCQWPVAILIATCSLPADECFDRRSRSWRYRPDGMILPARIQRPVTVDEQTQLGRHIRYVACYVTVRDTIRRIARGEDTGPTSFLARSDGTSAMDMCLSTVLRLSDDGNSSGYSIDALLNVPLPQNHLPQP